MKNVRVEQVNALTGEIMEGAALAVIFPKRKNAFKEGWVAMPQHPLLAIATAKIGDQARRVFLGIVATLDFENYINISHTELAEKLGMKRPNVGAAFKQLIAEGVVIEGPKVGRNRTYRLDPDYGWKGSARNHHEAMSTKRKATLDRARAQGMSVIKGGA